MKISVGLVYAAILFYDLILPSHLSCDTLPPEPDSRQLLSGKPFIYIYINSGHNGLQAGGINGGMSDFLKYTASWEQQLILKLMDTYMNNN